MGNILQVAYYDRPDYIPEKGVTPTFPPDYGFSEPRKVREPKITEQEMKALQIEPALRDYCAYLLPEYFMCRRDNAPFTGFCKGLLHEHRHCQYEDYIMRMKEYEREKRLRIRQKKLEKANG